MGQPGIEPGTSVLSGLRSSRLSYWPAADAFESTRPADVPAPEREESGAESVCGFENVTRSKGSSRVDDLGGIDLGKDPVCQAVAKSYQLVEELPRKEVIQPHLPVRLPCYDFVPIAGTTLGGCLPKGWLTDFRRLQLS